LDVTIQVQSDPGQNATSLCVEADVFHADSRVDAGRVQLTVEGTAQSETFNLRIVSSTPVDEPVVTIYLRAGCGQKTTRRYVMLADYASDPQPSSASNRAIPEVAVASPVATQEFNAPSAPVTANAPPPLVNSPNLVAPSNSAGATPKVIAPKAQPVPKPQDTKVPPPKAAVPAAVQGKSSPPKPTASSPQAVAQAGKPRLKLDPLENLAERIKTLEYATESVPLNDMVKDSQRMLQMQSDVKALLDQAAKNEVSLMAMRERLEKAESERVPVEVVYALGALVLLSLGGLIFVWGRKSTNSQWANLQTPVHQFTTPPTTTPHTPASAVQALSENAQEAQPLHSSPMPNLGNENQPAPIGNLDSVDLNLLDLDSQADIEEFNKGEHTNFLSEELVDIQQRAEFFSQLGKVDDAIESLEAGIRAQGNNALVLYLELFNITIRHNLKTDYRLYREEFQQRFNARVPEFALFHVDGKNLEENPELLHRISAQWNSLTVLKVLEAAIFKNASTVQSEALDLAALSDLIMLHGMVMQRVS
jgi:hypothetical protein